MRLRTYVWATLLLLPGFALADEGLVDLTTPPSKSTWLADDLGSTTIVDHPWGAFPDGNLSSTGEGQGRHRIAAAAFQDDSTLVFVPYDFVPSRPSRLLVHLHGWRGNLIGDHAISESQHIRESVLCSGTNTILVIPQGPTNVKSSRFGNLETIAGFTAFLSNLPGVLPAGVLPSGWLSSVTQVSISGHSGGGSPISRLLWDGSARFDGGMGSPKERWLWDKLKTVILFDATYGGEATLQRWWENKAGRRIKSYYLDHSPTAAVSKALASLSHQHPERSGDLRVEAMSREELPPALQNDAHYSIPWYRLWDGLDAGSGRCPWSDSLAEEFERASGDPSESER